MIAAGSSRRGTTKSEAQVGLSGGLARMCRLCKSNVRGDGMAGSKVDLRGGERRRARAAVWGVLAGCLLAETWPAVAAPKKKDAVMQPIAQIKLAAIGAPNPAARMLEAGASLLTVNVLDDTHLLVTFATRELVPRIAGDPDTDEDRIIAGEIVELPSGNVLAKTTWHVHDHARYLWPLGRGRFAVRIGDSLSFMEPMANLHKPDPFERVSLPHQGGVPIAVTMSPDMAMLTVVTQVPPAKQDGVKVVLGDASDNLPKPTFTVDFFRIKDVEASGAEAAHTELIRAGGLHADIPLQLPMDSDGYLWAEEDEHAKAHWLVTFNSFDGKVTPGGAVDSSCIPRLKMVSRSEYLATTCRGADDSWKLRSMGLDGHETWEEDFGAFTESPAFAYAPSAGRFAMNRTTSLTPPPDNGTPSQPISLQEVRVYQIASGDLLAKLPLTPMFRVPENFDLSADGKVLALLHDDEIDVYSLPELRKEDKEDIAEVAAFAPPVTSGPVKLARLFEPGASKPAETADAGAKAVLSVPVSASTLAPTPRTTPEQGNVGDVATTGTRQRPTLLNPGEQPEFKDKNAPPQ